MSTLRKRLERLTQPVEVDAIQSVVTEAEDAVRGTLEILPRRISDVIEEMQRCQKDVAAAIQEADEVHESTSQGLMATLKATVAHEQVAENRERSERNLMGAIGVLARRVRRALMLKEEADGLGGELEFAVSALLNLGARARGAELEADAQFIQATILRLNGLKPKTSGLSAPLADPVREARGAFEHARDHLAGLRTSERAATVGESLFDDILPPDGGEWTQAAREYMGHKVEDWAPDVDRKGVSRQQTLDELGGWVDDVSEAERKEEALRRAAE